MNIGETVEIQVPSLGFFVQINPSIFRVLIIKGMEMSRERGAQQKIPHTSSPEESVPA